MEQIKIPLCTKEDIEGAHNDNIICFLQIITLFMFQEKFTKS